MARERRSSTLPSKSIKAVDVLLVGLLTYASSDSSCLPRKESRWHILALILALTVAGQWRIFTAFPFTKSGKFYTPREFRCQRHFWESQSRAARTATSAWRFKVPLGKFAVFLGIGVSGGGAQSMYFWRRVEAHANVALNSPELFQRIRPFR
jgi:hypothetical protein